MIKLARRSWRCVVDHHHHGCTWVYMHRYVQAAGAWPVHERCWRGAQTTAPQCTVEYVPRGAVTGYNSGEIGAIGSAS